MGYIEMENSFGSDLAELLMPDHEQAVISLPAYRGIKLDYVVGDDFEKTVIWIQNAHIYTFHHQASISFAFAGSGGTMRFTARVLDRRSVPGDEEGSVFMYRVKMLVQIGNVSNRLDLLLCETPLMDAPAIMCRQDFAQFSDFTQRRD